MSNRRLEEFLGALSREAGAEELVAADEDLLLRISSVLEELAVAELIEGQGSAMVSKVREYASALGDSLLELRLAKSSSYISDNGIAPQSALPEEELVDGALERAVAVGELLRRAVRDGSPLVLYAIRWEAAREMAAVAIKQDVRAFRGVDLNSYGPFSPGDIAMVPREDARALVAKGQAEEVVVLG